jgi:hypothetical protein
VEEAGAMLAQSGTAEATDRDILDPIAKAMDDCVQKELNGDGILNHHLRIYLLALAADLWVQSRYIATRKEYDGKAAEANLNAKNAVDLLQALSPRRMFAKVVENHRSQIETFGKKEKEQYKKYAQDALCVCVACVENIALSASDWRKRFGTTAEVKSIYNAAILSLQGGDPSGPVLPVCQGAIERIQAAFSNSDQIGHDHISRSALLLRASGFVRRPVVTASRSLQGQNAYYQGYLVMLTKLVISSRIDRCMFSLPSIKSLQGTVRKQNFLRLALPPLPLSRNPAVPVSSLPKFTWGSGTAAPLGGSDAAAMTLSYSMRRNMRYDGETEFRLTVTMRVHNITAVEIPEGLRLNLTLLQETATTSLDGQDSHSLEIIGALNRDGATFVSGSCFASVMSLYKAELKSGDHLTWEVVAGALPMTGGMRLQPSVEFRAMEDEPSYATWIGVEGKDEEDASAVSEQEKSLKSFREDSANKDHDAKTNVTIEGQEMKLSPMIGLQPCPLVFFCDGCGDVDAFRFLWERLPLQIPPLKIAGGSSGVEVSFDTLRLAAISTLKFEGNPIAGGEIVKLWAFMSLSGKRVLFVLAESEGGSRQRGQNDRIIHVRGDDASLLCCLMGTDSSRRALTAALMPGMAPL